MAGFLTGRVGATSTPPRRKTRRRLEFQEMLGWPCTSKLVCRNGNFFHPTKKRGSTDSVDEDRKFKHVSVRDRVPRDNGALQTALRAMTGWQLHKYQQFLAEIRKMGKQLSVEGQIKLAESSLKIGRRDG
jgi:hypothetical protein